MTTISDRKKAAIERTMKDFGQLFSLTGGLVLEIGSLRNATAEALLEMGAESVVCSNRQKNAQVVQSSTIRYVVTDATAACFGSAVFDVVFGRAILEHISQIHRLRDEIVRILKPGGLFYLDGGPMWHSPRGHHLWLRAPSGRLYTFADSDCPVDNWEHLLLSENEMVSVLKRRRVEGQDVQAIVDHVYRGQGQNRLATAMICDAFPTGSVLDVVIIKNDTPTRPPPHLVDEYGTAELTTTRLVIAGRKKISLDEPDVFSRMPTVTAEEESTHSSSSRSQEPVPPPTHSRGPAAGLRFNGFRSLPGHFYWRTRHRVAEYVVRRHPRLARLYWRLRYGRS